MNYFKFKSFVTRFHIAYAMAMIDLCDRDDDDYIVEDERNACSDWKELKFAFMMETSDVLSDQKVSKAIDKMWGQITRASATELESEQEYDYGTTTNDMSVQLAASTLQMVPVLHTLSNVDVSNPANL